MGFFSSIFGKLRKNKTDALPVEYKIVLDFNKDFSDLLKKDEFLARSDYKHLIEQYKDIYVFFNSCQNAKTLQYYCKQNKVDEKTIDYFLHSYKDIENLQIGSTIINEHNENYIALHLKTEKPYLDSILQEIDPKIILDEEQRRVILSDEDYSLVIAGAGAGKTTTVAAKVRYLVEKKHIDPKQILVISFTNKAVGELKERINEGLKIQCPITTFHSAGYAILRKQDVEKKNIVSDGFLFKTVSDYLVGNILEQPELVDKLIMFFGSYFDAPYEGNDLNLFFNYVSKADFSTLKSNVIEQNIQDFLIALRSLADNPSKYGDHEYYSNSRAAKYAVWDDNNLTALLYCTYFANHIYYSGLIYQTENWNSLDCQEKKLILSSFVNLFNKETYELNDDIYEYIEEIAEWASFERFYGKDHFVSLFKEANKELKDINKTIIDNKEKDGVFSIETFKSDSPFYDSNPKEDYCKKEANINFGENDVYKISTKDLQDFAYEYCKQVLNYEIDANFEKVPLSFDATGVNEILKVIKDNNIVMSNYKYIDDLSFSTETRESGEFIELCNLMNDIKIVKDSNINKRIMCKTIMPKYNFSIGRIQRKQLNDLAVEEVCRALLISDNKYVINDAVYDKKEAMEYVKKNYRQDSVKIVIKHNFDKNKFFVLSYKNKRG